MPGRLNLPKSELRKLYLVKKMSSRKIAVIYGCAYSAIDNRIKEYGFPIRNLAAAHIKTRRGVFSGGEEQKAYLIGFRIGDLGVRRMYRNSETITVASGSTRWDQILHIKKLFNRYGHIWIGQAKGSNIYNIECRLNTSFNFLITKHDVFEKWIVDNEKYYLSAIAGFVDAEGSFFISAGKGTFSLGNYNLGLLEQIRELLNRKNIATRLGFGGGKGRKDKEGYIRNNDYWILSVSKKSELLKLIGLLFPYLKYLRKVKDAKKVLRNITQRNEKYGYINMNQ